MILATPNTALADELQGVWLTEDEEAVLIIADCGGRLCGRIDWLESAKDRSGALRLDEQNPDPAKRMERVCGLVVITELVRTDSETWDASVYNPQDGKTYSGRITVLSDNALRVRAYVGLPIFGKSETWKRVDDDPAVGIDYGCDIQGEE